MQSPRNSSSGWVATSSLLFLVASSNLAMYVIRQRLPPVVRTSALAKLLSLTNMRCCPTLLTCANIAQKSGCADRFLGEVVCRKHCHLRRVAKEQSRRGQSPIKPSALFHSLFPTLTCRREPDVSPIGNSSAVRLGFASPSLKVYNALQNEMTAVLD